MIVHYPTNGSSTDTFPVIAYAHGALGGGDLIAAYDTHFKQLASYGFIVVAPDSCNLGCIGGGQGWPLFQFEQTRAVDFAKKTTDAPWNQQINWKNGVLFAAHSMGGTALVLNTYSDVVKKYNIVAAANQHGFSFGSDPSLTVIPTIVFTGTADVIVPPAITKGTYEKTITKPKAFRNEEGIGHLEMLEPDVNPLIAYHTAAFFKLQLGLDVTGINKDAIVGNSSDSFCGNDKMKECEVVGY
jgi:hypothetical protein